MTDSIDEHLLTAAKLHEQIRGDLEGDDRLLDHGGVVSDRQDRSVLSFVESAAAEEWSGSELKAVIESKTMTDAASEAIHTSHGALMSHLVGITEQDLEADKITLPARILGRLRNNGALCTLLAAGAPNSGKTNTIWLVTEVAQSWWSDLLVISNAHADIVDERVTSAHDLAVTLLEHRDRPKMVVVDEGSTHFDARTNSYEVSSQWSPLLKRMSKLSVEVCAVIGHTGKDVDPEMKRLTNLALYKSSPQSAEFFARWPADSDFPEDRLFGGTLDDLEATSTEYDPDEPAPWSWNLEADLFARDLDWPELLDELQESGPAE